jgi:hypothetical protein
VGWQPSRFLANRAKAERAVALANSWAVSMRPRRSWARPGRRCARPSPATALACQPATHRRSASGRSPPPAAAAVGRPPPAWTRCLWPSTPAPSRPGNGRRRAACVGPPRRGVRHLGRQRGGRAVQRKPRPPPNHLGLGDHPASRSEPSAGRPTRQPARPSPHRSQRPSRPHQPTSSTPGAGEGGRCSVTLVTRLPTRAAC